jgi:hypothetical protein
MLLPVFPIYRKRRGRGRPREAQPAPPPPAALTLTAAAFATLPARVTLTFDRPVDIAGFVGNQITVRVGVTEILYQGNAATLVGPAAVRVTLAAIGPATGGGVKMTASAGTGIVAEDDGGTWDGVTDWGLPFP